MPAVVTALAAEQGGTTERRLIMDALHACHWNVARAASRVGVCYKTLYSRMHAHGIPTAEELTSFWWDGHWDTITGHAARLGLPKPRTWLRYRRGMPLHVVFWPHNIPTGGYANGTYSFDSADRPAAGGDMGGLAIPTAGVGRE